ncbi:MAG: hypothetical protein V2A63_02190 [Patescibacteria group bacterium]
MFPKISFAIVSIFLLAACVSENQNMVAPVDPENTSNEIDTSDWKICKGSKEGYATYTIKYPSDYKCKTEKNGSIVLANIEDEDKVIVLYIKPDNPEELSFEEWEKTRKWEWAGGWSEDLFRSIDLVDDIEMFELYVGGVIRFTDDKYIFSLENGNSIVRGAVEDDFFKKVVSTFKFIKHE